MKCPCYKCEERHQGCHAECERYLAWWGEIQKRKEWMKTGCVVADYQRETISHKVAVKQRKTKVIGGRHEQ